jgi:dephospho-CoA kinase
MRVLGITGGIATGKSTVTKMLADFGAPTISADTIARVLLAPGTPTTEAVLAAFPSCAAPEPGTIDRRALARIIFADPSARTCLEALTHPAIIDVLHTQIAAWRVSETAQIAAAEIPLLFEAGLETLADENVVVVCAEETQLARLCARDGIDEEEAHRQVAAQWPLADKIARADRIITTDGDWEETRRQVLALWDHL